MNMWREKWAVQIDPGCLSRYLEDFVEELTLAGYCKSTIGNYIRAGAHFGFWITRKNIVPGCLDEEVISDFASHYCRCPFIPNRKVSQQYIHMIRRIVDFLVRQGVVQATIIPSAEEAPVLTSFRNWLSYHRGLSPSTVVRVVRLAGSLCSELGYEPHNYTTEKLRKTACAYAKRNSRPQTKCFITAIRTFIKFLASQGLIRLEMASAIPPIPQWRLSSLPKYLPETDIWRIIESCDTKITNGVRDRAILLMLYRLALRAGDIVAMRIQDIDWEKGTIKLSGKGRLECHLPIPQDVGDALLSYLESARPAIPIERIFLCAKAPWRPLAGPSVVSSIVAAAIRRAGIKNPPSLGASLLRHSAATSMLRAGLELEAVSTILRHRSLDMTAYYAKVDVNMLQGIAQPWPEGGFSC
ncbi:MAG: site-specific integrase [Victivallales bacterium]